MFNRLLERLLNCRGGALAQRQPLDVGARRLLRSTSAQPALAFAPNAVHIENVGLISAPDQVALKQRVLLGKWIEESAGPLGEGSVIVCSQAAESRGEAT